MLGDLMGWVEEASVSLAVKWGHEIVPRTELQLLPWKQPYPETDAE